MTRNDKIKFLNEEILTTEEVCNMLMLSRQQIQNLLHQGKISVARKTTNGNLFLRDDIIDYANHKYKKHKSTKGDL